ncbi:hypothetical protein TNCV_3255451 [Trichonephila clavipes]|nr:hypothetical protein TNCV_3255451 [Trichonephila clavipes]
MGLPNSTDEFRAVIEGGMGTSNQHRTWDRKPRLVGENCDSSRRREDDVPDEGSGQANGGIFSVVVGLKKLACMQISHFLRSHCVPAHFPIPVLNHLHATYPGRCIGRGESIVFPPLSPDLNIPWISSSRTA